jgi:hypothetical protein
VQADAEGPTVLLADGGDGEAADRALSADLIAAFAPPPATPVLPRLLAAGTTAMTTSIPTAASRTAHTALILQAVPKQARKRLQTTA